jgi:DNA-binding GntR family transcriptional regulator
MEQGKEGILLTDEHGEMLAAIRDRDVARVDAPARAHTLQFGDNFITYLKRNYLQDAPFLPLGPAT